VELKIAAILIQAGILCGLLYVFGKDEADRDFQKVAMVVAVISLINFLVEALLAPKIGLWVLLVELAVIVFFVEKFCWLPWKRATLVALLLMIVNAGMAFGMAMLIAKMDASVDTAMGGTVLEKQMDEGMKVAGQLAQDLSRAAMADAENHEQEAEEEAQRKGKERSAAPPAAAVEPEASPRAPAVTASVEASEEGPDWDQAREQLVVTARMSDGKGDIVAVVNERMVNRGAKVAVHSGDYRYIFKLSLLTQEDIVWEPVRVDPL
jgi:hypothetical protein